MTMSVKRTVQRGSVSAFVVCLVMASLSLAGLVTDGGRIIATYIQISDVAENAARLGGQQVVGIRDGNPHVDVSTASRLIRNYVGTQSVRSEIQISGRRVSVTVEKNVRMNVLGLFGVSSRTVRVTRTAEVVDG